MIGGAWTAPRSSPAGPAGSAAPSSARSSPTAGASSCPTSRPAELEGAEVVQADLTDPEVAAASSARRRKAAPLRAVVNLVGGFAADQPVATTPVEEFEAQFALNLRPTYLVTQAALPALVAGRRRGDRVRLLALGAAPVRRRRRLLRVEGGGDRVRAGRRARARATTACAATPCCRR